MIVDIKRLGDKFFKKASDDMLINASKENADGEEAEDRSYKYVRDSYKKLILKMLRGDLGKWIFENAVYSFAEDEYCSDVDIDVFAYFIKKEGHKKVLTITDILIYCIEETYWVDYIIHRDKREWIYINVPWIVNMYYNFIEKKRYCIK